MAAEIGRGRHLKGPADVNNALTPVEELLSDAQLADDLLGRVVIAFHGASPGQGWPVGSSHKGWFSFRGPRQLVL